MLVNAIYFDVFIRRPYSDPHQKIKDRKKERNEKAH